jgi:4-hydroxyproline epimerase
MSGFESIQYVDSHTEGEPTRVIIEGGPELGDGPLSDRLEVLRKNEDQFRTTVILEPRGNDSIVGALTCKPTDESCVCGVIFFNNTGYLGMCGHAAIGMAVTLHYLGRIELGRHRLETPVGIVELELHSPNEATVENVPSYRFRSGVRVEVDGLGTITGDVAWGGNWFFLVDDTSLTLELSNVRQLSDAARNVRQALNAQQIFGAESAEIDHVEFLGPASSAEANSRNFVYCPGGAYDRSPCGTGVSAKIACLAAEGKLKPGQEWVQESIIGSRFIASYQLDANDNIIPKITGKAFICGQGTLIQQANDPFKYGIQGGGQ